VVATCLPANTLLERSRLYVLVDGCGDVTEFQQLIAVLVEAGVDILQLRDKRLADRLLLHRARMARQITQGTGTLFIMNDRPDLALLADADGVHVGQDELAVQDVRRIVGPNRLVGVSTHTIDQARQAVVDQADYLGCGPTFPSTTKEFSDFPGLAFLKQVATELTLPCFAIGGIGLENLNNVLETGFRRIAVGAAVAESVKRSMIGEARRISAVKRRLWQHTE
jgi:thiamine-phosphate pyrophosphorylase